MVPGHGLGERQVQGDRFKYFHISDGNRHLIRFINGLVKSMVLESQKICMTCFIENLTLLQWSGTEPTVPARYALCCQSLPN